MGLKAVFVGSTGHVRSGWVVVTFAAISAGVLVPLNLAAGVLGLSGWGAATLDDPRLVWTTLPNLLSASVATLVCHFAFREAVGLRDDRRLARLGQGLGLGLVLLSLACVVPALVGAAGLTWASTPAWQLVRVGLLQLVCLGPTAIGEELWLRGVPLRALSRGTHPALAVGLTGAVFGLLHLTNPNASPVAAAIVALVGWWFGALAVRTGSLWLPFGLHLGWNWCEGFVFGQPVSGIQPGTSLFTADWAAAVGWWSGGDFGPEAAGWTALLLVLALGGTVLWPARAHAP